VLIPNRDYRIKSFQGISIFPPRRNGIYPDIEYDWRMKKRRGEE
jgi:hypothetical protein